MVPTVRYVVIFQTGQALTQVVVRIARVRVGITKESWQGGKNAFTTVFTPPRYV